jgi:Acyl-CoA dehydrogenase, C-terminal domain
VMDVELAGLLTHSLRELFDQDGGHATALADLGWADVRAEHGASADALLFREQGRAVVASTLLDGVVLNELAGLSAVTGRAVVHPWQPDDPPAGGLLLADPTEVDDVVTFRRDGGVALVPRAGLVDVRPLAGFGQDAAWHQVQTPADTDAPLTGVHGGARAVAAAQRALAAELIGVCEAALAATVAHATGRFQYGRAIGSFQAVRHRLAEAHVAVASAQDVLDVAVAASAGDDGGAWEARLAKITAGRAQAEVMRSTVQLFGALGVTRESVVHRWVERAALLDAAYGSHRRLTEHLGRALLDGAPLSPVVTV